MENISYWLVKNIFQEQFMVNMLIECAQVLGVYNYNQKTGINESFEELVFLSILFYSVKWELVHS